MAAINISAARDPISGKLKGSYVEVAEGVNFIGTVAHGNTLTITDSLARFGTRTNHKPLFVNFGDSRSGNSIGRDTDVHLHSVLESDAAIKSGSLPSSWKLDIKTNGGSGIIEFPVISQIQSKPLIQYIERRYGFNFSDYTAQNNGYYFSNFGSTNTNQFVITIDGREYTHANDGTPSSINNRDAVAVSIAALINADALSKCTAVANDGTFGLRLTKKDSGQYFTVSYNSNISQLFNNKANRIYSWNNQVSQDAVMSTTANGAGGARSYMEPTGSVGSSYYDAKPEDSAWMCEEFVLVNSSDAGISDGFYRHYKNSELLNPIPLLMTYDVAQQPLGMCYLNQLSNGPYGYWRSELSMHVGYQCWDDEYNGIYLADSSSIVAGTTKLVRQPQSFWYTDRAVITQTESMVPLAGAYVHVRTGLSTFIFLGRLPV